MMMIVFFDFIDISILCDGFGVTGIADGYGLLDAIGAGLNISGLFAVNGYKEEKRGGGRDGKERKGRED